MKTTPDTRFASSGELSIAYQVVGDGPLDIVFVPGFASHVELNWDYVFMGSFLERLATLGRLVVFDKRGSGLSDRSLGSGTLEDRTNDLMAVMGAAGVERAALVGVSNGGPLAALFAATHPERVSALALAISGCPGSEPYDPSREVVLDLVRECWTTGLVLNMLIGHASDSDDAIRQLARFERYSCTAAVAVDILRREAESDLTPFLPLIQAPTLVINHRDDPIIRLRQANYLAEHVPDARQVVLEGDYHASWRPSDYDEPLWHLEEFLTGEHSASTQAVDRMLASVLFTDIVQSTATAAELGDAVWLKLLTQYDEISAEQVGRHMGVLVKRTGDGLLAHFDSPSRAVACAVAINHQVDALGVRTRSGVHTGEVERRGDDISGMAVNIAARVMGAADADEVLVSRTVKDLTMGARLEFGDRGEHTLKGVPGTWPLFAVKVS